MNVECLAIRYVSSPGITKSIVFSNLLEYFLEYDLNMAAKRMRGKPDNPWNAPKDAKFNIDVTRLAKTLAKSQARAFGCKSLAEFMEKSSRRKIGIPVESPCGIARLIIETLDHLKWEVEDLAKELDLELERIDKILTFDEPAEMHELIALQTIFSKPDGSDYDIEDLIEINQGRKTNGERKSVKHDS